jgi:Aminoglycoside-2''-adenylyltransferase
VLETQQLAALARIQAQLGEAGIESWLFGGWAVDFYAGEVTRQHADLDLAVWVADRDRIAAHLEADGWRHAPEPGEDGYTGYEREGVRAELAFLARDGGGVHTPLGDGGRGEWPDGAFGGDVRELRGVQARLVALAALEADKSADHGDPAAAAKDRADLEALERVRTPEFPVRDPEGHGLQFHQDL